MPVEPLFPHPARARFVDNGNDGGSASRSQTSLKKCDTKKRWFFRVSRRTWICRHLRRQQGVRKPHYWTRRWFCQDGQKSASSQPSV